MAARFVIRSSGSQYCWNLFAGNNEKILHSEMYASKSGANVGIASVKTNAPSPDRYERRLSTRDQPYFVLKARNGEIIGVSEMYSSPTARDRGIDAVMRAAPGADVVDQA